MSEGNLIFFKKLHVTDREKHIDIVYERQRERGPVFDPDPYPVIKSL